MFKMRSLCRTCGIKIDNKSGCTKLFQKSNYQLIRLIEDITDMFLESDKSMPDHICHECKEELNKMLTFRSTFLNVHQSFLATKKKHLQWMENSNKMGAEGCKDDDEEFVEYTDDMEDSQPHGDSLLFEDHIDQGKQDEENEDEHTEKKEAAIEEEQDQKYADEDQINTLANPEFLEEDEGQNMEEVSQSHKITARKAKQAKRNAKTWVCEQCGGVFKCSTYLKLHMLRHTGQKSFACDVCQARYYTENEMRRHRILHTDARPYACRFCDKTFRGCSSKVVHERTHTNERPFQCQYCEMAFTSTSTRQRHELLHTNNRKYHCETCQHWFLRATHLTLHQNTKLHKRGSRVLILAVYKNPILNISAVSTLPREWLLCLGVVLSECRVSSSFPNKSTFRI
ncbi:transcription factor Ouib [Drosophila serrata]|uniref:transcription factor Ouib n=1 Tax=Drosophila serrata TaxID=7274 RepID=UPI000A1D0A6F|nr:transcription factor Ouib [Drosophila serrata]